MHDHCIDTCIGNTVSFRIGQNLMPYVDGDLVGLFGVARRMRSQRLNKYRGIGG